MITNNLVLIPKYSTSQHKRLLDLVITSILLATSIPALLCVSLLILISSGWPILYTQKRLGKNKQTFTLYKFRTMTIGADAEQNTLQKQNIAPAPMFKLEKDPRFTQLGYYLSHTGIDELPQLFNVLTNDMSLVGPRPLPITEGNSLSSNWSWRWQVKPGLFSYWVLSPDRYRSLEKWKQLELQTIQINSVKEDLTVIRKILLQQMRSLFRYWPSIFQ